MCLLENKIFEVVYVYKINVCFLFKFSCFCLNSHNNVLSFFTGRGSEDIQVLNLPIIDSVTPRPPFLPLAVPEDLAPRLIRLHGDPIVWWVGQILKYLLKPQSKTAQMLQEAITSMSFQRPIVG